MHIEFPNKDVEYLDHTFQALGGGMVTTATIVAVKCKYDTYAKAYIHAIGSGASEEQSVLNAADWGNTLPAAVAKAYFPHIDFGVKI